MSAKAHRRQARSAELAAPRKRRRRTATAKPRIDVMDAKLLSHLQEDGRMRNTELARRLGITETAVRKRLSRLLQDGIVLTGVWIDPLKVGYPICVFIQLQVQMGHVERVAEHMAKQPEVFYIVIGSGAFDICAGALFRSSEEMYEFFSERLGQVAGILGSTTTNILRIVKRGHRYPLHATEPDTD